MGEVRVSPTSSAAKVEESSNGSWSQRRSTGGGIKRQTVHLKVLGETSRSQPQPLSLLYQSSRPTLPAKLAQYVTRWGVRLRAHFAVAVPWAAVKASAFSSGEQLPRGWLLRPPGRLGSLAGTVVLRPPGRRLVTHRHHINAAVNSLFDTRVALQASLSPVAQVRGLWFGCRGPARCGLSGISPVRLGSPLSFTNNRFPKVSLHGTVSRASEAAASIYRCCDVAGFR